MQDTKLIIFDLDGTLIDAYPAIIRSFNYTMRRLGYPARDAATIRRAVGWGDEFLLRPFVKAHNLKKALQIYRSHHKRALFKGSRLFPGVKGLLSRLKIKGKKIAVASNRPTKFSLILMRYLGLDKYLDYYLCADKLRRGKPDPEILNKIRRKFSLKTKDVIYVGDMVIDAQAGRRARVKTIVVTTGSSTRQELKKEKPYRIIDRITALLKLL